MNNAGANNPTVALTAVERRIKWSSTLIGAGLLVQLSSLVLVHPLAFVAFLVVGCPLVAVGIVLYLLSLLGTGQAGEG